MKKFFQKIGAWLQKLFAGAKAVEKFIIDHVDDAIAIVGQLQQLINTPSIVTLIAVLPPHLRDVANEKKFQIEAFLDKVITELKLSDQCLQKETFAERLACFVIQVRALSPEVREAVMRQFATLYVAASSGNEVKKNIINAAIESRFAANKNGIDLFEDSTV